MEEKKSTILSLAGTILMQIFISALFAFFFYYIMTSFLNEETALLVSSILSILFIFWISGTSGMHAGEKDHNDVLYQHSQPMMFKGFLSGLLAQIPGLLLLICNWLFQNNVFNIIFRILYNSSLYFFRFAENYPIVYIAAMLPFVLAVGIGYILGYTSANRIYNDRKNS